MMENIRSIMSDDRAQSEVLGFGISFATIIIVTIALSAGAPTIIEDAKQSQGQIGIQHNFVLLDDNVQEVAGGVDKRKYNAELPAGTLSQGGDTEITISGNSNTETITTVPITYRNENGDTVVYEGIGFIGQLPGNTPSSNAEVKYQNENLFRDNDDRINQNRNVMMIPALKLGENKSIESTTRSSTIEYNLTHVNEKTRPEVFEFEGSGGNNIVDLTVDTGNQGMWRRMLEKSTITENVNVPSDGTVTAEVRLQSSSDRLVIASKKIDVDFY